MNMILHGNEIADIRQGDTLSSPQFLAEDGSLETFDYAVANPPFPPNRGEMDWILKMTNTVGFKGLGFPPRLKRGLCLFTALYKIIKKP